MRNIIARLKAVVIVIALSLSCTMEAQVAEAFLSMPDTICPYLSTQQRVHLVQYAKAGDFSAIPNRFDGEARIDSINLPANYMALHVTSNTRWEITTLAGMICIRQTISFGPSEAEETQPRTAECCFFYDFAWNLLRQEREPFRPFSSNEEFAL